MNDDQNTLDAAVAAASDDCGCAPSPTERSAFSKDGLSRRGALGLGVLSVVALSAFGISNGVSAAYAASYPSWDDVQRAKNSEAAKAAEVTRIEGPHPVADPEGRRDAGSREGDRRRVLRRAAEVLRRSHRSRFPPGQGRRTGGEGGRVREEADRSPRSSTATAVTTRLSSCSSPVLPTTPMSCSRGSGTMDKLFEYNQSVYDDAVAAPELGAVDERPGSGRSRRARSAAEDRRREDWSWLSRLPTRAQGRARRAVRQPRHHAGTARGPQGTRPPRRSRATRPVSPSRGEEAQGARGSRGRSSRRRQRRWRRVAAVEAAPRAAAAGAASHGGGKSSGYGPRSQQCGPQGCSSSFHYGTELRKRLRRRDLRPHSPAPSTTRATTAVTATTSASSTERRDRHRLRTHPQTAASSSGPASGSAPGRSSPTPATRVARSDATCTSRSTRTATPSTRCSSSPDTASPPELRVTATERPPGRFCGTRGPFVSGDAAGQ